MKWNLQWKIRVPWGKLSLVSRGHPDGDHVFLVHGRQDSSSVFGPLVDLMPNMNHYVALDMPGNGLSDGFPAAPSVPLPPNILHYAELFHVAPMPKRGFIEYYKKKHINYTRETPDGPKLMRFHFLMAMELAIAHLGWEQFIFIGHSMGCEQGLFFNAIHPNRITKMVLLDANPTLMRMQVEDPAEYQMAYFDTYYENFHKENFERKSHTKRSAMKSLARVRELNEEQCADLLERNFHTSEAENWHPIAKWHPNEKIEKIEDVELILLNEEHTLTDLIKALEEETRKKAQNAGEAQNDGEAKTDEAKYKKPNEETMKRLRDYIIQNHLGEVAPNSDPKAELSGIIRHMRDHDAVGYLSWDNRLKNLAPTNYGNDYYFELFKTIPPTLLISASDGAKNVPPNKKWREGAKELLDKMESLDNFHRVDVEGSHDVHYTHPERVAPYVIKFLDNKVNSKL